MINSFCSGCIQVDNHRLYRTPTYYAQQLYATLAGNRPLKIESTLPTNVGPDFSATLSPGGDTVVVFAVNDTAQSIARPLDFGAFAPGRRGQAKSFEAWTLGDGKGALEPDATNSFADPERVAPRRAIFTAEAPVFNYDFPPFSLTVIKW